jgi:2-polyprenyl-3-methyl-5-hydroxy-6-metoxy-1,4-benzoquinol methylase
MTSEIRCQSQPDCIVCEAKGRKLYEGLQDRLFGVPGKWSISVCPTISCQTHWLDPRPTDEDLHLTYLNYYTHGSAGVSTQVPPFQRLPIRINRLVDSLLGRVLGIRRARKELNLMFLQEEPPGRLLEVGCGNGERLSKWAGMGWEAIGQDVDPVAVRTATQNGVEVHLGQLEDLDYPECYFDAIVSNHVIEHVSDPVSIMEACLRLLKFGGKLIMVTPNPLSIGHAKWGKAWFFLDPPRHLHMFSPNGLTNLAENTGFEIVSAKTSSARANSVAIGSLEITESGFSRMGAQEAWWTQTRALLYLYRSWMIREAHATTGEETLLVAKKP